MAKQTIGVGIKLDGEKDFKKAVSSINSDIRLLGSEMKKVESEYKGNADSLSALTAKSEQYSKIAEAQRKKVEVLQTAVEKSRAKYTAAGQNVEKYRNELSEAEKELDRLKSSESATTEEVEQQEKAVAELKKKLDSAERSYEAAEKRTKQWETSLNKAEAELNDTEHELTQTNQKLKEMGNSAKYSAEQVDAAKKKLSEFGEKAQPIANAAKTAVKTIAAVTAAAGAALGTVVAKSVSIGSDFEAQMKKVQAISGASQEDFEALKAKAEQMGASTKFTAKQAGEALEYMSMAGWDSKKMLDGLEGIMNLAAAAGEDLGTTSDIVTDALTAFKLEAKDSTHFADLLAQASSKSNTNVAMLGETFKYAAPICGTMGYKAEDAAIAIGLMANAGIKGSTAGTTLGSAITNMSAPTKQMKGAMDDLGISITNSDGSMKSLDEVLGILRTSFAGLTKDQQAAYAKAIFGKQAMSGMLAVINASTQDYNALKTAMYGCDGAAKKMADTMQDNLQGQITIFKSGLEGTAISIYNELQKPLTDATKTAITTLNDPRVQKGVKAIGKQLGELFGDTAKFAAKHAPEFIKGFQKISSYLSGSSFKTTVKSVGSLLVDMGKVALEIGKVTFPIVAKGMELLAKSGKVLIPIIAAGYAGFKSFMIIKSVTELAAAAKGTFAALNVVLAANPWALVAGAIAAVTIALIGIAATCSEAEDKYADLSEQVKETSDSMKDMAQARKDSYDDAFKEIYQVEDLRDRLGELVDKNGKLIGKKEELQSVVKRLNEKGFNVELNKTGDLVKNYKDLNKQISNYLEQKQYQAKIESLEPEYQEFKVNIKKYHSQTKEAQAAYDTEYSKLLGVNTHGVLVDPTQLWDEAGNFTDYYRDIVNDLGAFSDQFENAAEAARGRYVDYTQSLKTEETALKLIKAVDQAYLLAGQGKYAEANKALQDYFDERDATFKKAADYEKSQRDKAIKDLGDQLLDEVNLHKVYLETGSKEMIDASIGYIEQAADELAKVGIKIPDGIIEGLKNGTLSVDDAMKQIQEIIKNGGQVDLTEEGKEIDESLSNGLELGIDTVAETGLKVVDSAVKPMGAPTPISEAKQAGQDTGDAYADGVKGKSGAAEDAGASVSDSAVKGLGSSEGDAGNEGRKTGTQFSGGIDSQKGKAKQAGLDAGEAAVKGLISAKTSASTGGQGIGGAFASGITHGMNIKLPNIRIAASSLITTALNAAKKAAGINSPSKKAMDMVGKPIPQGVAVGIEKGTPDAARRAANATNSIIEKMKSQTASAAERLNAPTQPRGFDMSLSDLKNVLSGGRNITVNYENTFNSAAARDGEALLRQLDRALGAKI